MINRNLPPQIIKKLDHPSQDSHSLPEPLRGHNTNSHTIRHDTNPDNNSCDTNVHSPIESKSQDVNSSVNNTPIETDLVHLGRRHQDECSLFIQNGKRSHKALWDSGAGQCVLSFDCYNAIPAKYKTDLFTSSIKIRAANGTLIENKGECDITFKLAQSNLPSLSFVQLSCHNNSYLATTFPRPSTLAPPGVLMTQCPSYIKVNP